jgi:hypothetical protein
MAFRLAALRCMRETFFACDLWRVRPDDAGVRNQICVTDCIPETIYSIVLKIGRRVSGLRPLEWY